MWWCWFQDLDDCFIGVLLWCICISVYFHTNKHGKFWGVLLIGALAAACGVIACGNAFVGPAGATAPPTVGVALRGASTIDFEKDQSNTGWTFTWWLRYIYSFHLMFNSFLRVTAFKVSFQMSGCRPFFRGSLVLGASAMVLLVAANNTRRRPHNVVRTVRQVGSDKPSECWGEKRPVMLKATPLEDLEAGEKELDP